MFFIHELPHRGLWFVFFGCLAEGWTNRSLSDFVFPVHYLTNALQKAVASYRSINNFYFNFPCKNLHNNIHKTSNNQRLRSVGEGDSWCCWLNKSERLVLVKDCGIIWVDGRWQTCHFSMFSRPLALLLLILLHRATLLSLKMLKMTCLSSSVYPNDPTILH